MRFFLLCVFAVALACGAAQAQSRQPATKEQPPKDKTGRDGKDGKDSKPADTPQKTGAETVGGKTLKEWVNDTKGNDPSRRAIAILAIANFGELVTREAVKAVIDRLHDGDVSPRAKACLALRLMAIDPEDVKTVVKALGVRLLKDSQAVVRYEAAVTLRRFAEDAAVVLDDLTHGLSDSSSWEIRHTCASVLWRAAISKDGPDRRAVEAMVARLREDAVPAAAHQEKLELIIGLGSMGRTKDTAVNTRVLLTLKRYAFSTAVNVSRSLVLWAYAGLVALDDPKHFDTHLAAIAKFTSSQYKVEIRTQAIGAMAAFGPRSKKYVPEMIKLLDDKEPQVVSAAAEALTLIGESGDRDRIIDTFVTLLARCAVPKKDASALEKNNATSKAATAVFALLSLKANLKDVHDAMDRVRKNDEVDRGLRGLVTQAQKQLSNPPKKK